MPSYAKRLPAAGFLRLQKNVKELISVEENVKFLKGFFCGLCLMAVVGVVALGAREKLQGLTASETKTASESDSLDINMEHVEKKVSAIEKLVNQYYLDDIDNANVESYLYKGLIEGLGDTYADYYTEEELKKVQESNSGVYMGIGVSLTQDADTGIVTVVRCYEGTPAEKAGILPGDVLYKVADMEVTGEDLSKVVARIKTEAGDSIKLTIAREGASDYQEFEVERDEVEVPTVSYEMLENKVGYIAISAFEVVTEQQFLKAKEDLESQGMEKLVIDLRNNLGGVLETVCNMLNQMLPEGLIVYTEDKNGERAEYKSDGKNAFDKPLAVLVNGYSASASEIFAGAIKDYGIGTLVGTTTYGKGIVQRLFPMEDGTAVKMTIAKYFTPKGNDIHKVGIQPDVEVELDESLKKKSVITREEDNQLKKALEVLEGK